MKNDNLMNQTVFVREGKPNGVILYSCKEESSVPFFAASELQRYIQLISGAVLPVKQSDIITEKCSKLSSALVIVAEDNLSTDLLEDSEVRNIDELTVDKKEDSLIIESNGNHIYLTGTNHRGMLYAVYAFLEQLGVRFHAPNFPYYEGRGEFIPEMKTVTIEPLHISEEPSLVYRIKHVDEGDSFTKLTIPQMIDWMGKKRLNTIVFPKNYQGRGDMTWEKWKPLILPELDKRGITLEVGGHGYQSFIPESQYKDKHPEWFPKPEEACFGPRKKGANIFHFTNKQALQTYIQNVLDYLKKHPEIKVFHAWPPDAATWAISDLEQFGGRVANAQAYIVNQLIKAVKKELPQVRIETLSYSNAIESPDSSYMYDEETVLDFAANRRSYEESMFSDVKEENEKYLDILSHWRQNGFKGDIRIYEYYVKYVWRSMPIHMPRLIMEDIKGYVKKGLIDGLGIYCEPGNWLTYELTHRLTADISWNAELDLESYMQTFLDERFPGMQNEMKSYYEHCELAGRSLFNFCQGNYDDQERVEKALQHFHRAKEYLQAARGKEKNSTASFLLQRYYWNIQYAISVIEISLYQLLKDEKQEKAALKSVKEWMDQHHLDGIIFKTFLSIRRYEPEFDDRSLSYKIYGEAW